MNLIQCQDDECSIQFDSMLTQCPACKVGDHNDLFLLIHQQRIKSKGTKGIHSQGFTRRNLSALNIKEQSFSKCDWRNCILIGTEFSDCHLDYCSFSIEGDPLDCNFVNSRLRNTTIESNKDAKLKFILCSLVGVEISFVDQMRIDLDSIIVYPKFSWTLPDEALIDGLLEICEIVLRNLSNVEEEDFKHPLFNLFNSIDENSELRKILSRNESSNDAGNFDRLVQDSSITDVFSELSKVSWKKEIRTTTITGREGEKVGGKIKRSIAIGNLEFRELYFYNFIFQESILSYCSFDNCFFSGSKLKLKAVRWDHTVFKNCRFGSPRKGAFTVIEDGSFFGCDFNGTTFTNVHFKNVDLRQAKLGKFENCTFESCMFEFSRERRIGVLEGGSVFDNSFLKFCGFDDYLQIGPKTIFDNSQISHGKFRYNYREIEFNSVLFNHCTFSHAEFWMSNFDNVQFNGSQCKIDQKFINTEKEKADRLRPSFDGATRSLGPDMLLAIQSGAFDHLKPVAKQQIEQKMRKDKYLHDQAVQRLSYALVLSSCKIQNTNFGQLRANGMLLIKP